MLSKFGNLNEFFDFLELKRAEIQLDYEIEVELMTKEQEFDDIVDEEVKTIYCKSTKMTDIIDDATPEVLCTEECSDDFLIDKDLIQIAWSTSLETPKKVQPETPPFDNQERTDTTLIMEQLNLDDFDYDEEVDFCLNELIDDYTEMAYGEDEKCQCLTSTSDAVDPLGLDSLSFPMSQFPNDFDERGLEVEIISDSEEVEVEEVADSEVDSDSVKSMVLDISEDEDKFDFEISMSQFPTTQPPPEAQFFGFKTGKGSILPPPLKEAMKRAHSLIEFEEFRSEIGHDDDEEVEVGNNLIVFEEANKRLKENAEQKENAIDESLNIPALIDFPSFSTAKGKPIAPPSKEALDRARGLIETDPDPADRIVVGFATAKGKSIPPPSKEALERAKAIVADVEGVSDDHDHPSTILVGFSTGKGKALPPPSKEALRKAASLISDDNAPPPTLKPILKPAILKTPPIIKTASSTTKAPLNKPFSLSTAWKRPRKPAAVPADVKLKQPTTAAVLKLFDLDGSGMQRFKMKEFFKRAPNLSISLSEYNSNYEIDKSVLVLDCKSAQEYKFQGGWGFESAHQALLYHGAISQSVSLDWTRNHYRWIIWKFASLLRAFPDSYSPANLSPQWVLSQLMYRYEREVHLCQRSALKKIIERDDAAGKYLCLMLTGINLDNSSIELSDGWYSIWSCSLDPCFWDLIKSKRVHVGMKMEISGASLTGQDAIPALEASDSQSSCRLVICRNSCRPARWDTKLGFFCTSKKEVAFLKHLNQIHPQGGAIPAVSVIIERVYPLIFRESSTNSTSNTSSTSVSHSVSRNERDHFIYLETLTPETLQSVKFTPIQRIRIISNNPDTSISYIVTFWNSMGEDQRSLLQEGTAVIITNLRTTRNSTSLASSKSTRIFKDSLQITYNPVSKITQHFSDFKTKTLKVNESFDFIGIIALGRVGNYFWFCERESDQIGQKEEDGDNFSTYTSTYTITSSLCLMCLKNFNCSALQVGDQINFRDLTFNLYDAKVNVAHFSFTDYSDFKRAGKLEDATIFRDSFKRFKSLIE